MSETFPTEKSKVAAIHFSASTSALPGLTSQKEDATFVIFLPKKGDPGLCPEYDGHEDDSQYPCYLDFFLGGSNSAATAQCWQHWRDFHQQEFACPFTD